MSILLYLPGLLVVLFRRGGLLWTLLHSTLIGLTQVLLALPFLREDALAYLQGAFNLQRVFLYKWTVNWKFVQEETFLSSSWANSLLIGHAATLMAFAIWRWFSNDGGLWSVVRRGLQRPTAPAGLVSVTADGKLSIFTISGTDLMAQC
jgi:alpha-1,3-mannosyltransferase